MDIYTLLVFLHIAVAIVWVGGAFGVVLLGSIAIRRKNSDDLMAIARMTESLAKMIFMPASLIILVLGVIMVSQNWSFADAWVVFGIAGVVMTGYIGGRILTPLTKQLAASEDPAERDSLAAKLFTSARADVTMLFVIIWAMVSKPAWSDWIELALMAAIIIGGAVLFIRR